MFESHAVAIKRIYDPPQDADGFRVLVDRLWPRGVTKEDAKIDCWAKDLAPTSKLRRWFGHDPAKFAEFRALYLEELQQNDEAAKKIRDEARQRTVTLLYAARDRSRNHATVLQEFLSKKHA